MSLQDHLRGKIAEKLVGNRMPSKSDIKNPEEGDMVFDSGVFWVYEGPKVGWAAVASADLPDKVVAMSIVEAVGLAHVKGPDGKCQKGCPACEIEEVAKVIRAFKKMEE